MTNQSAKEQVREILNDLWLENTETSPIEAVDQALSQIEEILEEQYTQGWNSLMQQAIDDKIMPVDKFGNPPYALLRNVTKRWDDK